VPTIDQWFAVYAGQRAALESIATQTAAIKAALEAQAGAGDVSADVAALAATVDALQIQVATLAAAEQPDWPAILEGNTAALSAIGLAMPAALHEAAGEFGGATIFQTLELSEQLKAIERALIAALGKAPAAGGAGGLLAPLLAGLIGQPSPAGGAALDGAKIQGILNGPWARAIEVSGSLATIFAAFYAIVPGLAGALVPDATAKWAPWIEKHFGATLRSATEAGVKIMSILDIPFETLFQAAQAEITTLYAEA